MKIHNCVYCNISARYKNLGTGFLVDSRTSGLTSSSLLVKSCRWLRGFLIVVGSEELRI